METQILIHKSGKPILASRLYGRCWDYRDKPRINSRWKRLRQMYAWVRDHDEERLANARKWRRNYIQEGPLEQWYRERTGFRHPFKFAKDMKWHTARQRIWAAAPERTVKYEWTKGPMPKDRMFRILMDTATYRIISGVRDEEYLSDRIEELKESGSGGGGCWQYHHDSWGMYHNVRMALWRKSMHEKVSIEADISAANMHRYVLDIATRLFPEEMSAKENTSSQLSLF